MDDFSSNVLHIRRLKLLEALGLGLDSSKFSILLNLLNLLDVARGVWMSFLDVFKDVLVQNCLRKASIYRGLGVVKQHVAKSNW